jgi:hypothetical protein
MSFFCHLNKKTIIFFFNEIKDSSNYLCHRQSRTFYVAAFKIYNSVKEVKLLHYYRASIM